MKECVICAPDGTRAVIPAELGSIRAAFLI